ncbi:MAG: AAA family ATPase [Rhodocyclaceae bacterium]|nr:AAA family ATPase [Rhodocyclaceae bacterium]
MADCRGDQAAGLRRLFSQESLRVITFAAGGEGVGKTAAVANIAAAMAREGKEVLVLDENAAGNVASVFGAATKHDLYHVINRDRRLGEVLVHVTPGVRVLPAARAVKKLGKLARYEQEVLIEALGAMEQPTDVILVNASTDHPLGFSPFGLATHETVVVAAASGAAITDAYALIKKVSLGYERRHFRILVNKVKNAADAAAIHANLAQLARQRGVALLDYAGHVPLDDALRHAARLGQPVVAAYPESAAAAALRTLADDMLHWPPAENEAGGLEQFVQQLLHFSQRIDPVAIHAG